MKSSFLTIVSGATTALAATRGFNYASQGQNLDSFRAQFNTAKGLAGADDYTGARLYTMIQDGTTNTPIGAIQAAIDTGSTLLLGLWASQNQAGFDNELAALRSAISQYGPQFADLVTGISVGSEDLYRISPTGIENNSGIGQSPEVVADYIRQVRQAISGTVLGSKPVGHVDTWNVYVNSSNSAVIAASDFLGLDEYPYYETTNENSIDNAKTLFFDAYNKVAAVSQGKPIWITEAGWPTSGPTSKLAVASVDNAEKFWQDVACELERRDINTWWYILADAGASPSFGVSNNGQPLYDLSCSAAPSSSSSSAAASSSSAGSSSASASASATSSVAASSSTSSPAASTTLGTSTSTTVGGSTPSGTGSSPAPSTSAGTTPTTTGSSGAGGATTTTATVSPTYTGAASRLEATVVGLLTAAVIAAFAL